MAEDLVKQIREQDFDAEMASNLAEIVRISVQAGKDEAAASLAAKDAEIERLREDKDIILTNGRGWRHRAEQAERALAEAVEVLRPFASEADGPRLCGAELGDDWKPFLHRSYNDVDITNGHLRAARAFVAQHGSDSREGK
jgi:hypothetical protein